MYQPPNPYNIYYQLIPRFAILIIPFLPLESTKLLEAREVAQDVLGDGVTSILQLVTRWVPQPVVLI
jgi:hypothetical protein